MCLRVVFGSVLCFYSIICNGQNTNEKPAIVIGIVVDQMCFQYLNQFKENFGEGGFNRLRNEGFSFEQHFIPYASTFTAPGHATIYTGALPAIHGIVSNNWIERATENNVYCVSDPKVVGVGGSNKNGAMSPVNLFAATVGDELKKSTGFKSKVYGIALKDRGAILAAGHAADGAFWFDERNGAMISSSYYYKELPQWTQRFNKRNVADSFLQMPWEMSKTTIFRVGSSDVKYKRRIVPERVSDFPYSFQTKGKTDFSLFKYTPYGNAYTIMFAKELIANERLGINGQTDFLSISFSATDYAAHEFGSQSPEVADVYARLDKEMASFLNYLDNQFGKNYLVFLTSDHGTQTSTDYLKDRKQNAGSLNLYAVKDSINQLLKAKFGVDSLVLTYNEAQFYLKNHVIRKHNLNRDEVYTELAKIVNEFPEVLAVVDLKNIHRETFPEEYLKLIANSYHRNRSGDMHVILRSDFTEYIGTGSDHGSIFNYDRHLPMLWYGWQIPKGKSYRRTYITDIAPTLSAILNIPVPGAANGNIMAELLNRNVNTSTE